MAGRCSTCSGRRSGRRRCARCSPPPSVRAPGTRAKREKVIGASVAHGIEELLAERALATDAMQHADIAQLRALMDEARARRLQPHYIEGAFRAAFTRLGGKIRRRERGRFEITHVPAQLRTAARGPIATR